MKVYVYKHPEHKDDAVGPAQAASEEKRAVRKVFQYQLAKYDYNYMSTPLGAKTSPIRENAIALLDNPGNLISFITYLSKNLQVHHFKKTEPYKNEPGLLLRFLAKKYSAKYAKPDDFDEMPVRWSDYGGLIFFRWIKEIKKYSEQSVMEGPVI